MLTNLLRVAAFMAVVLGAGVLAYSNDSVLGFIVTGLTLGLLLSGVLGIGVVAWSVARACLRAGTETPAARDAKDRKLTARPALTRP